MLAYQIHVNGQHTSTAGLEQGVVSAIANWVSIPTDDGTNSSEAWHAWHAGFSVGGLDNITSRHLKWFRCDIHVGDEISIKLIETESVDNPTHHNPQIKESSGRTIDNDELHRLCARLEAIDKRGNLSNHEREALRKAGFALIRAFDQGSRSEIEEAFAG